MSQQDQQQYDLSRLLKEPTTKRSTKKKTPAPVLVPPQSPSLVPTKQQIPISVVVHHSQAKQMQPLRAQQQREQIELLRDFVTGYVDYSAVKPISKQTLIKFVKTFKAEVDQDITQDDLVRLIKGERKRFLRNQSQIQRRQRLATILPPSQKQLQQQQNFDRLHDYLKGFDHDSVLNPISKQTILKFVRSFKKDVGQQSTREQLIQFIDNQKKRLYQQQLQQQF